MIVGTIFIDVNATSLHTYYRDRLQDAFLPVIPRIFAVQEVTAKALSPNRGLPLTALSFKSPYHLINATINLQNSNLNLRGRDAGIFTFSKNHIGGPITGYCGAKEMQEIDPQIDLATAMAVSGAAIAPNQGVVTNRALRYLMAIANARLGYWLVNPNRIKDVGLYRKRVSTYYFFRELFGLINEKGLRIYLSDGGHFDNTGAYSLLQRRCRYVIAVDGECDPESRFSGLSNLILRARVDLGIRIEINLRDVRKSGPNGFSRDHAAVGTIHYPAKEGMPKIGKLLYLKSSLTGNENEHIYEYRSRSDSFPHESTADQFFTEPQFEAYRELGFHIGEGIFGRGFVVDRASSWDILEDQLDHRGVDANVYLRVQQIIADVENREQRDSDGNVDYKKTLLREKIHAIEYAVLMLRLHEFQGSERYSHIVNRFRFLDAGGGVHRVVAAIRRLAREGGAGISALAFGYAISSSCSC
jgi:hypothetical protein